MGDKHRSGGLVCIFMSTPQWGGHIIFAFSGVWRPLSGRLVSAHLKEKCLSYLTKFGMRVYWVNNLHGIAFGEDRSIAN